MFQPHKIIMIETFLQNAATNSLTPNFAVEWKARLPLPHDPTVLASNNLETNYPN